MSEESRRKPFQGSATYGLLPPVLTPEIFLPHALIWAALFLWLLSVAIWASLARTTARSRTIAAVLVALGPVFCPSRGLLSTLLTGLAVVFAVRMPDLERERSRKTSAEVLLWLTIPVFRCFPTSRDLRKKNQADALGALLEALFTFAAWIPVYGLLRTLTPAGWAWPYRSAALVLYFVLIITSLEALLRALVQASGGTTDRLFERPLLAVSLRDFWGRRWNKFIARFALRHIALRQRSKTNSTRSVLVVFFWSALFHEYFALGASGAGWRPGRMLLFFIAQGVAMVIVDRIPLHPPRAVANVLTAVWMVLMAPLFFASLEPPLLELGYPASWFVPAPENHSTRAQ